MLLETDRFTEPCFLTSTCDTLVKISSVDEQSISLCYFCSFKLCVIYFLKAVSESTLSRYVLCQAC